MKILFVLAIGVFLMMAVAPLLKDHESCKPKNDDKLVS